MTQNKIPKYGSKESIGNWKSISIMLFLFCAFTFGMYIWTDYNIGTCCRDIPSSFLHLSVGFFAFTGVCFEQYHREKTVLKKKEVEQK